MASEVQGVVKALVELAEAMRVERVAGKNYKGDRWEADAVEYLHRTLKARHRFEEVLRAYVEKLSNA